MAYITAAPLQFATAVRSSPHVTRPARRQVTVSAVKPTVRASETRGKSMRKEIRDAAAAGALGLSLFLSPALQGEALALTTEYAERLQAVELEEIKKVESGFGPPVAKDPALAAQLTYVATGVLVVAGATSYFENTPTNRLWKAKQEEKKALAKLEAAKKDNK
ncbi:hypothetical protein CYMTET_46729 [Cymbomonas tetramitiformis]|uniref:Uncharacterized protein n=1 Tax=Cymbomonas tetramitiformis TaxID=36881 RepID=A0AAE0BXE6_9CHLO|nr:hypothetical protein CYMTET_46729 [Cymbomonas tetramitiformis]